jgi:hypothetical protein
VQEADVCRRLVRANRGIVLGSRWQVTIEPSMHLKKDATKPSRSWRL